MSENTKKEVNEKPPKMPKVFEKFIWLAVSAVIALIGIICRTNGISFPFWGKVIYISLLLFTIIMAAQRTSVERFIYASAEEAKKKYILTSILYYIFIIIAVGYVFISFWISEIISL